MDWMNAIKRSPHVVKEWSLVIQIALVIIGLWIAWSQLSSIQAELAFKTPDVLLSEPKVSVDKLQLEIRIYNKNPFITPISKLGVIICLDYECHQEVGFEKDLGTLNIAHDWYELPPLNVTKLYLNSSEQFFEPHPIGRFLFIPNSVEITYYSPLTKRIISEKIPVKLSKVWTTNDTYCYTAFQKEYQGNMYNAIDLNRAIVRENCGFH